MRSEELLIVVLIAGVLLFVPLIAIILSIIAIVKTRRLNEIAARLSHIEATLKSTLTAPRGLNEQQSGETLTETVPVVMSSGTKTVRPGIDDFVTQPPEPSLSAEPLAVTVDNLIVAGSPKELSPRPIASNKISRGIDGAVSTPDEPISSEPVGWETFIGQKAFGWIAVVLFLFSAAFFLRYAYQNNWIGPVGRVAIGELAGTALIVFGYRYFLKGWHRFSSMLMSAGIVGVYLATYSAFGFYHLLPQQHAGTFLAILILESMLAALMCRSATVAMVAVVGGLLTPVLMQSDYDNYSSFFTYLAILNLGAVIAVSLQRWRAVGSVAFAGTQLLFWTWYHSNYHPEKFVWALGFQMILFAMYLGQSLAIARLQSSVAGTEELVRFVANAVFGFLAFRALTNEEWSLWIGAAALTTATLYAATGRLILAWRPGDQKLLLTALAVAVGFVAWAIPVQANAHWIALGWSIMATMLFLFGLRVSSQTLRLMAAVLICLSVGRVLVFDLPLYVRDPFIPVFNRVAFPSLIVAALCLYAVLKSDRYLHLLKRQEQLAIGVLAVTGITLLWLLLSLECHGYFVSRSMLGGDVNIWRWRAQLALTVFWIVFAIALMTLGFRLQRARLRWFAMLLFGVTVCKVFIIDMANVQQIYRIVAFFVLAMVLGLVARKYQRFK